MNITVLTPEKEVYNGPIQTVKVPGTKGRFQVLNSHAPVVSSLDAGSVVLRKEDGEEIVFQIESGFVEVLKNEIALLVSGISGLEEEKE